MPQSDNWSVIVSPSRGRTKILWHHGHTSSRSTQYCWETGLCTALELITLKLQPKIVYIDHYSNITISLLGRILLVPSSVLHQTLFTYLHFQGHLQQVTTLFIISLFLSSWLLYPVAYLLKFQSKHLLSLISCCFWNMEETINILQN